MNPSEQIEIFEQEFAETVSQYADKQFNKTILPYLKKNNYQLFVGGGWGWFFFDDKGENIDEDDLPKEICELMNIPVGHSTFGDYMPDYKGEQNVHNI